jgi:tetratricopeptide (TPR) repeat protein
LNDVLGLSAARIDPRAQQDALWDEWFGIPLGLGVLLCLIAISGGRSTKMAGAAVAIVSLVLSSGGCEWPLATVDNSDEARAALQAGDYAKARAIVTTLEGYDARFLEGVTCYRLKDYPCALQAFARAAWLAPDDTTRGRAAFNLGNAHFRLGDYAQASMLFAEAGILGVTPEGAALNRSFADSLAAAVERQLADNTETLRRAAWRAEAFGIPEELLDRVAEGVTLSDTLRRDPAFATLSAETLWAMIVRGVAHVAGKDATSGSGRHWVETSASKAALSTAGLFNHLLPIEAGILSSTDLPYAIEGQRPW